jgi:hypothetical protein
MVGKFFIVVLLLLPLAASIYFLVRKKKTKLPWYLTGLLVLVAIMCLLTIGIFVFTIISFK